MSSSHFDSEATTPTRASFDQLAQGVPSLLPNTQNSHHPLDTIPSMLSTNGGQNDASRSSVTDIEAAAPHLEEKEVSTEKAPRVDPNLVVWSGPDDPENPQNYSVALKWTITMLLSSLTVWITFATSVFSQATLATAELYGVSTEVTTLATSLPLFGFALGPIVWGPLSELYGRKPPLFFGYLIFAIFQIPVAVAQNLQTILVARFFVGFFGCAPLAVIGGTLADIWNPVDRAVAIALFSGATFGGPTFGPIIGGFIVESHLGWRWTAWITLIASGSFMIVAYLVVPETYGPVILQRRAARLRVETKNWALHATLDENPPNMGDIVTRYLLRPFQMLFLEPILLCITIYQSLIYGILYLTFEAFPISFQEVRGWSHAGVAALPFLSILIGVFIGGAIIIFVTKTRFARKMEKHGRVVPEERLIPMMLGSVLLPVGLFWFGWTSSKNISWVPQVIAGVPIGTGILIIFMQGLNYIIDVYLMYANSAISGNTLVRSAFGGAFPLFASQMYKKLGVDWASSLLGFLTVALIPIPILFYMYGARLRAMSRFNPKF